MKKSFKIKKSVVESMVDNAIRSLLNEGFDYDDLSQDVMHWALNYADSGHDFPINAVQYMQEWYNGDDSALDVVCERFAEWKGIECDDNVRSAVEKAANTIGYYENWNNDKIEFDEAKEAQAVEDMRKKIRSMSQKISSTDEELPELRRQVDALKNKLSTMDESFKSQKLKDFARQHGGLKNGKWSADFKNDLYNMSDEDFDTYKVVNQNDHYRQYGLNGWDTNGYSNNNFQPIEFSDGTFMVKKNPELRWDDRAKGMMDKQIGRRNSRRNDGKNEYQFENPYLNDKFNQEYHISKPRGSWGYGTDWKLEPSNINMTALRSMEGYDKYPGDVQRGDVAAKAKASRKGNVSESKLNSAIQKSIKKVLNEGIYDYPDGIDHIIFLSENDRELYEEYRQIAKACMKLYKKDVQLTLERLMESSIMKRYQQHCFRKYAKEQQGLDRMNSPREFRRFIAEKIIDEVVNGAWDDKDMMNEVDYSTMPKGDFYERDAWWKQQTDNDFPEHNIKSSTDWRNEYSRLSQDAERKEHERIKQERNLKKLANFKEKQEARLNKENLKRKALSDSIEGEDTNENRYPEGYQEYLSNWPIVVVSQDGNTKRVKAEIDGLISGGYCGTFKDKGDFIDVLLKGCDIYINTEGKVSVELDDIEFRSEAGNKYVGDVERTKEELRKIFTKKANENYRMLLSNNVTNNSLNESYGYQNVPDDFVEKVGENGYDVLVPEWCLPYLINGDRDNYEDDEIAAMDAFVEKYNRKLAHNLYVGDACMPMDGEEPSFYTHNDITGNEGCDCYRVFLPAKESEQMNEGIYPRVKDKVVQNLEWIKIPDDGWFEGGMSCGIIDHEKKTVTPCHGYYFPNPKSSVLRNIAKRLGYQYNDEEFEKYMQKKQNNKKS